MSSLLKTSCKLVAQPFIYTYTKVKDNCNKVVNSQYLSPYLPDMVKDHVPVFVALCATLMTISFVYILLSEFLLEEVSVADRVVEQPIVNMQIVTPTPTQKVLPVAITDVAAKTLEIIKKPVFNITEQAVKCFPASLIKVTKQLVEVNVMGIRDIISEIIKKSQENITCYDNTHYNHYNVVAANALKMLKDLGSLINASSEALLTCRPELLSETAEKLVGLKQPVIEAMAQARAAIIDAYEHGGCFDPATYRAIIVELLPYQIAMLDNLLNTLEQFIGHGTAELVGQAN